MERSATPLLPKLQEYIQTLDPASVPPERKDLLQALITYGNKKLAGQHHLRLNFICTHNSRRSQFGQIWAQTAAAFFGVPAEMFSGGIEITAFNPRAVRSLERAGFQARGFSDGNPVYEIVFSEESAAIQAFSKLYDDPVNPTKSFAAVMTCSHADDNCPFIPGADKRIALNYDDPKEYDDSPQEAEMYDARSRQIANELFYVFSRINNPKDLLSNG